MRARWEGFSFLAEYAMREVDGASGTPGIENQNDSGFEATFHYRFPTTNWGVGVKYGLGTAGELWGGINILIQQMAKN